MAKVLMTLGVDDAGNLLVNGPLHDKVMCYGLLEAAKDAVRNAVAPKPGVIVAPPGSKIPEPPGAGGPNGRLKLS